METYLPLINGTLVQLYQFVLANPLYTAVIAIVVWFVMAIFYSIRIAILKRRHRIAEQARVDAQASLENSQQQLQQNQEELLQTTAQWEQDKVVAQQKGQRLTEVEGLIGQRNQQIFGLVQTLAMQLDLGERPIPVSEDIKSEDLWQQNERVVKQLLERLRNEQQAKTELQQTYQTETAKLAEKEVMLATMRTTLDLQTGQIASLEAAVAEQKQLLAQAQAAQPVFAPQPPQTQFIPQALIVEPVSYSQPVAAAPEPAPEVTFLSPQVEQQPARVLEEAVLVVQSVAETIAPVASVFTNEYAPKPVETSQPAPAPQVSQPVQPKPESNQPSSLEQEYIELGLADAIFAKTEEKPVASSKEGMAGKLKGMFGKKPAAPTAKIEETLEASKAELDAGTKKIKGWIGKLTSKNK